MPSDWALSIVLSVVSGLFGAGGLAAYLRMRTDARLATASQQDEHTLNLRAALDKDEADFRKAVYDAFQDAVARTRELDARLSETQARLIRITTERDELRRQLDRTQADLDQANARIRHLETEIAALREQREQS